MHLLQRILPFKCSTFPLEEIKLSAGERISLKGYFQIFHLEALQRLTVSKVALKLRLYGTGETTVTVKQLKGNGSLATLLEQTVQLDGAPLLTIEVKSDDLSGIGYIELIAKNGALVTVAEWGIERSDKLLKTVRLGIAGLYL